MIRLTIVSKIPLNYGQVFKAEVAPEDTFGLVLERLSLITSISYEKRMFLRCENGQVIDKSVAVSAYLNSDDDALRSPLQLHSYRVSRLQWAGAVVGLLLGLFALIASSWAYNNPRDILAPTRRGVAIDAGSSHTSFALYEWPSMNAWQQPNELKLVENCYENFGIDDFRDDPDSVGEKFKPCLDEIYALILALEGIIVTDVRVYLGATAGVRLLNLTDPEAVERMLISAEEAIEATGAWYVPEDGIRILTGSDEAIYGWISANIYANTLGHDEELATFSALDMGGGSAQKVNSCAGKNCSDWQTLYLFGGVYDVTSSSALCYGLEEAMKRFTAALIYQSYNDNNKTLEAAVTNPCLDQHFERDTWLTDFPSNFSEVFNSPCTIIKDTDFMALVEANLDFQFEHKATMGAFDVCNDELKSFLQYEDCSNIFVECFDFDKTKNVADDETFYAMASYIWVWNFLSINGSSIELGEATSQIKSICNEPDMATNGQTDCFELLFTLNVLTHGYGFTADNFKNILFLPDYGESADWTLGLMASEINKSGIWRPEERITRPMYILVAFFSSSMTLLSGAALATFWRRQYARNL